ncbi:hypothetical protein AAF712_008216 [Marasmius tenuissimus]|uniref:Uncharacterized protein n=1 Tax=Marasmius tenuissimus TaxID=585030 RepID=A0ABR2ZUK5_9AGAR
MGTRGLIVYRYKRVPRIIYNHWDSYPEGLGLQLLREIPKPSDGEGWQSRFNEWLAENRRMVEESIAKMSPEALEESKDQEPSSCVFGVEWIYEMDLDNLCFLVNGFPDFALDNLPPASIWSQYETDINASDHEYVHKTIPYPSEEDLTTLEKYTQTCTGTVQRHELLGHEDLLTHSEQLRVRWVEMMVGCDALRENDYLELKLEANDGTSPLDAIPLSSRQKLKDLLHRIFLPYYHGEFHHQPLSILPGCRDIYLLRKDVVFCLHNHLDNPNSLRTGSYYLFRKIMDNCSAPVSQDCFVYGILFSGTRCAIVRIDRNESTFTHTPALSFLPNLSRNSSMGSPTTDGISALARLASRLDPDIFDRFVCEAGARTEAELLERIAHCFDDFLHLRSFALTSPQTRAAAVRVSHSYIYIDDFRLIKGITKGDLGDDFDNSPMLEALDKGKLRPTLFRTENSDAGSGLCAFGYGSSAQQESLVDGLSV